MDLKDFLIETSKKINSLPLHKRYLGKGQKYKIGYDTLVGMKKAEIDTETWRNDREKAYQIIKERAEKNYAVFSFQDEDTADPVNDDRFFHIYTNFCAPDERDEMLSLYVSCNLGKVADLTNRILKAVDGRDFAMKFWVKADPDIHEFTDTRGEQIVIYSQPRDLDFYHNLLSNIEASHPELFNGAETLSFPEKFTGHSNMARYKNPMNTSPNNYMTHVILDTFSMVYNDTTGKNRGLSHNIRVFDRNWEKWTDEKRRDFINQLKYELASSDVYIEGISDINRKIYNGNIGKNSEQKNAANRENISGNSEQRGTTADRKIPMNTVIEQIGQSPDEFDVAAMTGRLRPEPVKVYWTNAED